MRYKDLLFTVVLFALVSYIAAAPAPKNSGADDCGITTVFVTVTQTAQRIDLSHTSNKISSKHNLVPTIGSENLLGASAASTANGYSYGPTSSFSANVTNNVQETLVITSTVSSNGITRTETTYVTYSTSSSPADSVVQSDVGQLASLISTEPVYSSGTVLPQSQSYGETPTDSNTYVVETLTVIPLATLPPLTSSGDLTATFTVTSTFSPNLPASSTKFASDGIFYGYTGVSGTSEADALALTESSSTYPGSVAVGWNISSLTLISRGSTDGVTTPTTYFSAESLSSFPSGTGVSSNDATESINFTGSLVLPTTTANPVAQSGFAPPLSSSTGLFVVSSSSVIPSNYSVIQESTPANSASSTSICTDATESTPEKYSNATATDQASPIDTSAIGLTSTASSIGTSESIVSPTATSTLSFTTSTISTPISNLSSVILGSSTSSLGASSTGSSLPNSTDCNEPAEFVLNFDDLPQLAVFDNTTAQPMPLFNPYHKFYFSGGFRVVPPPTDPYLPSSKPLLLEFLSTPLSDLGTTGAIGNGLLELSGCFNFNALGLSVGCDSRGPSCDWAFSGYRYNPTSLGFDQTTSQNISTPSCPSLTNCPLIPISLDGTFQNLTEIHIHLTVAGADEVWWMDDLHLSWYDRSCGAVSCRQGSD